MKSLWMIVLSCIFSLVSGFSPFTEYHDQFASSSSSSSSTAFLRKNIVVTRLDEDSHQYHIYNDDDQLPPPSLYGFQNLFHGSYNSNEQRRNAKEDDRWIIESYHVEFDLHDELDLAWDDDEEEGDIDQEEDMIDEDEDSSTTSTATTTVEGEADYDDLDSQMFSIDDNIDEHDAVVNEIQEASNLDRRMHALGMISVHCEMEMKKYSTSLAS